MKNITKILFVAITSLSMMFSVNAGELTVNGTAKATYNATSGTNQDNGLGVTNELNFTASGEMDNGYTWSYSMELDPSTTGSGQANNDDTQLSLTMNDMGTIKVCVSECGNNKKYKFDQSAYTNMSDVGTSYGITYPGASGDANRATIQYHTPELPFATVVAAAFSTTSADGSSGNATGTAANGDSMNEYSLTSAPIDGLTLHAQVYDFNAYADGVTTNDQSEEGGAYAATYAFGNATIGYGKSYKAPAILEAVRAKPVHPTAYQVFESVKEQIPNISLATVYRDLGQLADNGIINTIKKGNVVRYDGNTMIHQHFYCEECGSLFDQELFDEKFVFQLKTKIVHEIENFDLMLTGTCIKCKNNGDKLKC